MHQDQRLQERRSAVAARIDALGDTERENLAAELAIDTGERCAYQSAQAAAFAQGFITAEVAGFLYRAIGEGGTANGWPVRTPLADRVVALQLVAELLARRLAG